MQDGYWVGGRATYPGKGEGKKKKKKKYTIDPAPQYNDDLLVLAPCSAHNATQAIHVSVILARFSI